MTHRNMLPGTAYLLAVQDRPIHTILCILSISGAGEFNKAKTSPFPSVNIPYQLAVAKQENTVSNAATNTCLPGVVIPWTVHVSARTIPLSLIPKIFAPAAAETQQQKAKIKRGAADTASSKPAGLRQSPYKQTALARSFPAHRCRVTSPLSPPGAARRRARARHAEVVRSSSACYLQCPNATTKLLCSARLCVEYEP